MTPLLFAWLAACAGGTKDVIDTAKPDDTDDFPTVPVNMFVVDREHGCVRYASVPMPAAWWEGWPVGYNCMDSYDPFWGEVWSGYCIFMPNGCWSQRMDDAETTIGGTTGLNRGCHVSGNEPCDCPWPYGLPICGGNTTLIGSECLDRDWPASDCGFWPTPL